MKLADAHKIKDFKATSDCCSRFMNKKNLVIRQETKITQILPSDLDNKIANFRRFIIGMRNGNQYHLHYVENTDETPLNFDLMTDRTVDIKGAKTVQVRKAGHGKTRFRVVSSCMADGTKLKPMVILKSKTEPMMNIPSGVFVHFHEKG